MNDVDPSVQDTSPLSHHIPVADLPAHGREVSVTASDEERSEIAKLCDLPEVAKLEAEFRVSKGAGALLAVQGTLEADVTQICSVTLKPLAAHIEAEISQPFTLKPSVLGSEVEVAIHDDDPPEPVINGEIDFGALTFEHFVLNLDPYPRAPDAAFDPESYGLDAGEGENAISGPFSALAGLKVTTDKN